MPAALLLRNYAFDFRQKYWADISVCTLAAPTKLSCFYISGLGVSQTAPFPLKYNGVRVQSVVIFCEAFLKCSSGRSADTAATVQPNWQLEFQRENITTERTPHSVRISSNAAIRIGSESTWSVGVWSTPDEQGWHFLGRLVLESLCRRLAYIPHGICTRERVQTGDMKHRPGNGIEGAMVCTSLGSLLRPLFYFLDDVSYPQSVVERIFLHTEMH